MSRIRLYLASVDVAWGMRHPRPAPLTCVLLKTTRSPIDIGQMLEEAAPKDEAAAAVLKALKAHPGDHPGFSFGPLPYAEVR